MSSPGKSKSRKTFTARQTNSSLEELNNLRFGEVSSAKDLVKNEEFLENHDNVDPSAAMLPSLHVRHPPN